MKIIADLQLHSRYSRAVSQQMNLVEIARWAQLKGINLIATGDFTHPLWFREITANLVEITEGLFRLKNKEDSSDRSVNNESRFTPTNDSPLFILEAEVSSVYTQGGKGRRIHNMIYAPTIATAEKINQELTKRGCNLMSDGRPMIGLSSIELCELVFTIDEKCLIVPAHCWTPWYSLYGSKSGFDSIEECFGKYANYIYAIETGLSSDPAMNWRIKELDNRAILSSSDAHSGPKLGREATIFEVSSLTYTDICRAIKTANYNDKSKPRIAGTLEFYPEEGKYHYTGHLKCNVRYSPEQTRQKGTTCPVCGQPLTVGVMHRVDELAGRSFAPNNLKMHIDDFGVRWIFHPQNAKPPYTMLVPLLEILAEVFGIGLHTQTVQTAYRKLTTQLGNEFHILLRATLEQIAQVTGTKVATAIGRVRKGDIHVDPGYDGEFGKVKLFADGEKSEDTQQEQLGMF